MDKFQINVPLQEFDAERWVMSERDGYMRFMTQDSSNISVTTWNHLAVGMHSHAFYEFALLTQGSCVHSYQGVDVLLIPGDVFLIAPHEFHGYVTQMPIEIINCQFYGEGLNDECSQMLEKVSGERKIPYDKFELKKRWNELLQNVSAYAEIACEGHEQTRQNNLNRQGVIHLETEERRDAEYLLQRMMREQRKKEQGFANVKSACLQMILVMLQRIQKRRLQKLTQHQDDKREQIFQVIDYMEEHLAEKIDLTELAKKSYWSEGYFRAIFKDVTGLAPVEYLNRLRIVKSLEHMEKDHLMISEAAEKVGIYDPSYYSRLFKKVIGYSPRYFKSI
ncbi:AraC family transcriptional regulator [Lawsonibacter sp. OA9]|uniref:AraC family transcriptional regulator n=1 Tax=Oscillospiraceae TaxID=216572 RepID=UPI001F06CE78|nr:MULTISPECIES: AraC family transcriptional regulator [Oscillospiraceae]MCH1980889.1 AraC family transcriptional regulator [Lawsonibacter sp. OA9]MCH1982373.1 AraC family transcriptional regulator [Ruminococcus sp. OA3]